MHKHQIYILKLFILFTLDGLVIVDEMTTMLNCNSGNDVVNATAAIIVVLDQAIFK